MTETNRSSENKEGTGKEGQGGIHHLARFREEDHGNKEVSNGCKETEER